MSMSRWEREDMPSFPEPDPEHDKAWVRLENTRPFERGTLTDGTDYHGGGGYDKDFGGFVGRRLVTGYWMMRDDDE